MYKTVRTPRLRYLSYLIGEFELYDYQIIQYDGSIKKALDMKREIDDNLKDMIHLSFIQGKLSEIVPEIKNYNSYTNQKFLNTERVDSQIVNNMILEFLVICAIKIVVFIILNRLFYFLFERSISRFLRLYSFKVFLLEVLLL